MMNYTFRYKYFSIPLLSALLLSCGSNKCNMDNIEIGCEYRVFSTLHAIFLDGTESDDLIVDDEFVESLPKPVKAIIVRYSASLPEYVMTEELRCGFARLFGDFDSLEEVQASYMKIWGEDFKAPERICNLTMTRTEDALIFESSFAYGTDRVRDEFKVGRYGKIKHIGRREI